MQTTILLVLTITALLVLVLRYEKKLHMPHRMSRKHRAQISRRAERIAYMPQAAGLWHNEHTVKWRD